MYVYGALDGIITHLYAFNNWRMDGPVFMKSGMEIMELETNVDLLFLLSYQWDIFVVVRWGSGVAITHDPLWINIMTLIFSSPVLPICTFNNKRIITGQI